MHDRARAKRSGRNGDEGAPNHIRNSNVKQIFVCGYFIGYLHHFIAFYRRWKVNFSSNSAGLAVHCTLLRYSVAALVFFLLLVLCWHLLLLPVIVRKEIRYQTRTFGEFLISPDIHRAQHKYEHKNRNGKFNVIP